ncbi:MAG: Maf family protein, partial [Nitrospiraceae bacterium]|nr:Maf family protein [Nitrospiraceae bacterium]
MYLPIVLASTSPRRRELLKQIGLDFSVVPADVDERALPGERAEVHALRLAREKAEVVAGKIARGVVIAADTIVVLDGQILGKPAGPADARRMLAQLSGREHSVMTGIAVAEVPAGRLATDLAVTAVRFRQLAPEEIDAYVATGEPLDKAGAYGIQEKGALFVEKIDGCYSNVVGLPLARLGFLLK